MLLQNDRDSFGFCATESEMIVADTNLNWITEGCTLYHSHSGTGYHAHFHQTNSLRIGPFNCCHAGRHILWNHV
jgi:hypothetical protein